MPTLRALIPDATINYIKNPALRYDTTDWNAQGSTISRVLTRARFGIASLKVVTTGSAVREGVYFRVSALSGISEPITVSAYVRGDGKVRIRLDNNVVGGTEFFSDAFQLTDDRWTRIWVTGFSTGGNDLRLFVETDEGTAKVRTFYVDGAQLERKSYPTTYCDGDQEGCRWNGVYHNSSSQRLSDTRAGGRWIELSGPEREAEDLYMTTAGGLGMAPLTNNTQTYAQAPGAYFSNSKVNVRPMTFLFHAKHKVEDGTCNPVTLEHLHNLRQMLIDIVKPDRTAGDEDIWFEYHDGTVPLYFQARYDGGLDGDWDVRNQFVNSFPLRLLAVNPIMYEDTQNAQELDFQETVTNNFTVARIDGQWNRLNFGMNDDVLALAIGPRGEIYAGGLFTTVNNNAAAIDPSRTARVAYWDGEKWVAIATSLSAAGTINAIAVAPNGYVYVGGSFTTINGVAANHVAYYNGSTWNAMGTGLNVGVCRTIAIAPNGYVYVGGDHTTAGGIVSTRIAMWDGTKWNRVGQYGGLNAAVFSISIDQDGTTLYAGGSFTDENGNPGSALTRVAKYNLSTGMFSAMSSGIDTLRVNEIKVSKSGIVYACGRFTTAGGVTVNNICYWDGSSWNAMGSGVTTGTVATTAEVLAMELYDNGDLLIGGYFDKSGTISIFGFALWNGSTWTPFDINSQAGFSASTYPYTIIINNETQDIFVGFNLAAASSVLVSGFTTITNPGSMEIQPDIYLKGPGTCFFIENQTTKKRMYLNLTMVSSEEVVINLRAGTIKSNTRGDVFFTLLPGSDFRNFVLSPGDNVIACFMTNDVGALMSIQVPVRHWSVDATQRGDIL